MFKKTTLAAFAAALAFAALPALAAANPEMDYPGDGHFTVSSGEGEEYHGPTVLSTTDGTTVTCAEVTGTGQFTSKTTGNIQFTFHGCHSPDFFNVKCTSSGQESGTIVTDALTFHLRTITGDETPAVLITPNNPGEDHVGHFASFNCSFLASVTVTGTGVIGEITDDYNKEQSTFEINFESTEHGHQAHTTVDHDEETDWDLHTSINGGEASTSAQDGEGTLHFTEGKGELTKGGTEEG